MEEKRTSGVWIGIALLLVAALYVGTYYLTVEAVGLVDEASHGFGFVVRFEPDYAYGGAVSKTVFCPMNYCDRLLRPTLWDPSRNPETKWYY